MNKAVVEKFVDFFGRMNLNDDSILKEIYSEKVAFMDPIHQIHGLEALRSYFRKLNENLLEGAFVFTEESIAENKVYLSWEMNLKLKSPQKRVKASGISVLTIEEKIVKHRDYFDAGELFYENVPLVGGVIRFLKKKIAGG
ncbi:MAG: nuclear transport factor 2 family protein [Spirochaetia bacterium]|nr:nuclear transport factor 2 family protein [Spirochaetia bacterium]